MTDKLLEYKERQRRFVQKHGKLMSEFYIEVGGKADRNIEILKMFSHGRPNSEIAIKFNITKERVKQIVCRYMLSYIEFLESDF